MIYTLFSLIAEGIENLVLNLESPNRNIKKKNSFNLCLFPKKTLISFKSLLKNNFKNRSSWPRNFLKIFKKYNASLKSIYKIKSSKKCQDNILKILLNTTHSMKIP